MKKSFALILPVVATICAAFINWETLPVSSGDLSSITLTTATIDGQSFVDNMLNTIHKWQDYTCLPELDVYKDENVKKCRCRLFFKDEQVRVESIGGGYRDGAILVKLKDGSIRAKGGLMLGHMTMNLDPSSRMLILPNGFNVMKIDLPSLVADLKRQLGRGCTCRVTAEPIHNADLASRVYILDVTNADSAEQLVARIFVDPQQMAPLRWNLYTNGKNTSTAWFKEIKTNAGLSDSLFQIK